VRPPTDEEIASYHSQGWVVAPAILPDELLDDAVFGARRLYAGERDRALPVSGGYLNWVAQDGPILRLNDYVSLQVDELEKLVRWPLLAQWAARLAGAESVRLFHDQLVGKPADADPGATTVGWHSDVAYWSTCASDRMLTAWIPLQECTEEMGPLTVIDGSHRWPGTQTMRTFLERDLDALERRFPGAAARRVPLALRRGQVSFHHCRTIHGSAPNRSGRERLALTVHFQDGANRYREAAADERATLHVNDVLCRRDAAGLPDYADPAICPVLWPPAAPPPRAR
jgi:hypothetical protein